MSGYCRLAASLGLMTAATALFAAVPAIAAPAGPPRAAALRETLVYRVSVGADGKVTSAKPFDPNAALVDVGQQYATRLVFTPAQKNGHAVPSTTCATLQLAGEPRPDKTVALRLLRAINGPCVVEVGSALPPKVLRGENGGLVVLGADLLPDGHVNPATLTVDKVELRVPSTYAEARYVTHAKLTMRGSRFELDTVDGAPVAVHVSAPFEYGGGPEKKPSDEERKPDHPRSTRLLPSWNATSTEAGVQVAKIDYSAPPADGAKP